MGDTGGCIISPRVRCPLPSDGLVLVIENVIVIIIVIGVIVVYIIVI